MPDILPSAASELLYRLTETLEIPFTLTDRDGVVVASTAGRPAGHVDAYAIAVVQRNVSLEITEHLLRFSPAAEHAGLLPPTLGVYVPVKINGRTGAVLFARGEPDVVRTRATSAAAVAGLTLEFANSAKSSVRDSIGPDMAIRTLLRGPQSEAKRATLTMKVAGWNLLVPRIAITILAAETVDFPDSGAAVVRELLAALAPNTPSGRMSANEVVALPPLPRAESDRSVPAIAQEIARTLADQGLPVMIGLGEAHIDLPIVPGLRRSYREAEFAASWARRLHASAGVHTLRSLGPVAFLAPGTRGRDRYAHDLLAPLRASPDILQTVRIFLDSDLSLEATAKTSGQHRHTVRSHLQRARELTGLDPRVLSDAVQLKLALLLEEPIQVV